MKLKQRQNSGKTEMKWANNNINPIQIFANNGAIFEVGIDNNNIHSNANKAQVYKDPYQEHNCTIAL